MKAVLKRIMQLNTQYSIIANIMLVSAIINGKHLNYWPEPDETHVELGVLFIIPITSYS